MRQMSTMEYTVAPFVGAWIEIFKDIADGDFDGVAPFVGAWIEMPYMAFAASSFFGRSVRRSVD